MHSYGSGSASVGYRANYRTFEGCTAASPRRYVAARNAARKRGYFPVRRDAGGAWERAGVAARTGSPGEFVDELIGYIYGQNKSDVSASEETIEAAREWSRNAHQSLDMANVQRELLQRIPPNSDLEAPKRKYEALAAELKPQIEALLHKFHDDYGIDVRRDPRGEDYAQPSAESLFDILQEIDKSLALLAQGKEPYLLQGSFLTISSIAPMMPMHGQEALLVGYVFSKPCDVSITVPGYPVRNENYTRIGSIISRLYTVSHMQTSSSEALQRVRQAIREHASPGSVDIADWNQTMIDHLHERNVQVEYPVFERRDPKRENAELDDLFRLQACLESDDMARSAQNAGRNIESLHLEARYESRSEFDTYEWKYRIRSVNGKAADERLGIRYEPMSLLEYGTQREINGELALLSICARDTRDVFNHHFSLTSCRLRCIR